MEEFTKWKHILLRKTNPGLILSYDKADDFHPLPDAIRKGTVLVLLDETMTIDEFKELQMQQELSKEEKKARREKDKQQKLKEREIIKKQKLKEAKRRKKLSDAGIFDVADYLKTNKAIEKIEKTMQLYATEWRNVDEYLNSNHNPIQEWVTENELSAIHRELRALVDEYMRLEYELLKKAWCFDKKKKYKARKPPATSKRVQDDTRKAVDPTANRNVESLYQELCDLGIVEKQSRTPPNAFISDFNYLANDTRDEYNLVTAEAARGDLKMAIQDCMFGLGEYEVDKPKSMCIVGPDSNGKRLLCNIISYELDAIFMNLSPEKTHQFADNLNYFIDMVMKVAKAFQPTIMFIENVHRIFWKRIPKNQMHLYPTLLQKAISKKLLKSIKKTDRIMLLGTSNAPWEANAKFRKTFEKILMIPRSDYGSAFLLWFEHMSQAIPGDLFEDYFLHALTKVFQDYNSGDVVNNINGTLKIERRMRLHWNHLSAMEFLDHFISRDEPHFLPQEKLTNKFERWFNRSNPYLKKRIKFLQNKNTPKK